MKAEESILGPEPYFKEVPTDIEIVKTLNWYNYFYSTEDAKKWTIQWLKSQKKTIDNISKVSHDKFPLWVGMTCRQLIRGSIFPDSWVEKLNNKIKELSNTIHTEVKDKLSAHITDKGDEKRDNFIAYIEDLLDQFYLNNYKFFDHGLLYWIKQHHLSKRTVLEASVRYLELKEELDGNSTETEGYSRLTVKQYQDYKKFVNSILETIITYCQDKTIAQTPRKPRKKKEKSPIQLTKKVKYLSEYNKIKSVDPTAIIGAQQVWFYNTKYKVLTKLESNGKLSIKGTTVIGFDEKSSECKRLRKPDEVISKVLNGGKIILRKIFKELSTKEVTPKGRLNSDTIILRVIK